MTKDQILALYELTCDYLLGYGQEACLEPEYSGRGMYGETTPGIVTSAPGPIVGAVMMIAAKDMAEEIGEDVHDFLLEAAEVAPGRQDSMGLETIYY